MANLIRRRQEGELVPALTAGRLNPMQLVRDMLGFDPFQAMLAIPPAFEGRQVMFVPDFEVKETPESYIFKADLPGVEEQDLDISLTRNRLVVSGKREAEERNEGETFYAYERSYGSFTRAFTLPEGADADNVRADLKDGVLTLEVPKRPEQQPKKIEVKAQQQPQQPKAKA
jgi:HSP20 family protein